MSAFLTPPIAPLRIELGTASVTPEGPTLIRRLSDLEGLFCDDNAWRTRVHADDEVVYDVVSSPVPEVDCELPQSITTIYPGTCGDEFFMTKGHLHPNPQAEIYVGMSGRGGLLLFDGTATEFIEMDPGVIDYIPPGWAHRSINIGDEPYRFLAVYPGGAGHDYGAVREHGLGHCVVATAAGYELIVD